MKCISKKSVYRLLRALLVFCLYSVRALLGPANCRYAIGCTEFAAIQLQEQPLHKAVWITTKRLFSCNPISQIFNRIT